MPIDRAWILEAMALRVSDLDLDRRRLTIHGPSARMSLLGRSVYAWRPWGSGYRK